MRVLISSVGTRGDVQPALALALEVRDLGHEVSLCIPPNFTEWASRLSLEARPLGIEMRTPRSGEMPKAQPKVGDLIADQFRTVAAAANGCDVIVGAGIHQYAARSIAELHDIPFVIAAYAPVSLPSIDLPPPGNDIGASNAETIARMWDDSKQAWNSRVLEPINDNRKHLGLSAVEDVLMHILGDQPWLAADPSLAPPPSMSNSGVVQLGAVDTSGRHPSPSRSRGVSG